MGTHDELIHLVGEQDRIDLTLNVEADRVIEAWRRVKGVHQASRRTAASACWSTTATWCCRACSRPPRARARITSVDIREPNLEAVFLHLTGRALRD